MPERKLIATLRALHDGGVEFILVGGLAGDFAKELEVSRSSPLLMCSGGSGIDVKFATVSRRR